jgi:DegV family protein with EDD domain
MAKVLVMTDSVSGMSKEIAQQYGIKLIPAVNINISGKLYLDGVDITPDEAYRLIQKDPDSFKANTLRPGYLVDRFKEFSSESNQGVFITFASSLSTTNKIIGMAADLIKKEMPQVDIRVIDSKTAAGAQGLMAIAAAKAANAGASLDQIVKFVTEARPKIGGIMLLDTLRYVYRTGRYSKTTAMLASILQIKPINKIKADGTFDVVDKVRKRADGFKRLIELIKQDTGTTSLHFMVSHAAAPEIAEEFIQILKGQFNCLSIAVSEYSPIMGYASGPRCIFVGYHPELGLPN